ncbi:MAG: hypothetical protein K0S08_85 [Gammaproteobacteria bacterium]|jgi:hypothetical protein|nr:hypothetical protein [Gammaproteobacteria bacterium]
MRKLLSSLTIFCWIFSATANSSNIDSIETLFSPTEGLNSGNGGQFTMTASGTLHFLEIYFYSGLGCSTLMSHGIASFADNGSGMPLNVGQTYTLDGSSVYQLASNRGLTANDITCIRLYMDGGNNSPSGASCINFTENCAGSSCSSPEFDPTNTNWVASPTACVQRYAYITSNAADKAIVKCTVDTVENGGTLSNCITTGPSLKAGSLGNAFNNGYSYFSNNKSTSPTSFNVSSCSMDPSSSGTLNTSCTNNSFSLSSGYTLKGIAISGIYAYIINGSSTTDSGQLEVCNISSTDGSLSNCTTAVSSGFNDPRSITINNGYAYITNNADNTISTCTVSGSTVSNCSSSNPSSKANAPRGITTYDGYLYFINSSSNASGQVASCPINNDGTLGSCSLSGPTSTAGYQGITIYNRFAYLVNSNTNRITKCDVDSTTGTLSNCSSTATDFSFTGYTTVGISIY